MVTQKRPLKVNCTSCGKRQGTCFAYCVMCGARLPQENVKIIFPTKIEP